MAVKRRKLGAQPAQVKDGVDPAQQVISWNPIFQIERVKQTVLTPNLFAQHHRSPLQYRQIQGIMPGNRVQRSFSTASAICGHQYYSTGYILHQVNPILPAPMLPLPLA
jgi:hypothetical protein